MKNSEIASARAQVALAKITGDPIPQSVKDAAGLEFHDASQSAPDSDAIALRPSWFDAVFELRRAQEAIVRNSRHRRPEDDGVSQADLDADVAVFRDSITSMASFTSSLYLRGHEVAPGDRVRAASRVS